MSFIPIIIFICGCFFGASIFWFFNKSQNSLNKDSQASLKAEFGDLSKQALDQNLDSFLKLAENKFSDNEILENLDFNKLPKFLIENQKKYSKWLN